MTTRQDQETDGSSGVAEDIVLTPIYSEHQTNTLTSLYYVTPPFSLVGSLLIIYVICRPKRTLRNVNPTFLRLMVGYAAMDVIQTVVWLVLGPWATPADNNPFVPGASGNIATCNAKGVFLNFTFGLMLYSMSLASYHAMAVSLEWPDYFIAKGFEPVMHAFSWLWPTFVGLPSLSYGNINPYAILPGTCWVTEGTRGNAYQAQSVREEYGVYTFLMSWFITLGAFLLLFFKARQLERRVTRMSNSISLSAKTGWQGMRYSLAFLLCNISWPFLVFAERKRNENGYEKREFFFVLAVFSFLLTPLQGFVNAMLFLESHHDVFDRDGPLHFLKRAWSSTMFQSSTSANGQQRLSPPIASSTERGGPDSASSPTRAVP